MKYKAIDRTNIDFTSDAEICNIGYFEKEYQDVPIRAEKFFANGITCVTIFIPKIDSLDDEEKIKIIATLFPQYDFAKQIGGDKVEVSLLLTPGTETHTYESTPTRYNKC